MPITPESVEAARRASPPKSPPRSSRTSAWAGNISRAASTGSPPSSWASSTSAPLRGSSCSPGRISPPSAIFYFFARIGAVGVGVLLSPPAHAPRLPSSQVARVLHYRLRHRSSRRRTRSSGSPPTASIIKDSDHDGDPHTPTTAAGGHTPVGSSPAARFLETALLGRYAPTCGVIPATSGSANSTTSRWGSQPAWLQIAIGTALAPAGHRRQARAASP